MRHGCGSNAACRNCCTELQIWKCIKQQRSWWTLHHSSDPRPQFPSAELLISKAIRCFSRLCNSGSELLDAEGDSVHRLVQGSYSSSRRPSAAARCVGESAKSCSSADSVQAAQLDWQNLVYFRSRLLGRVALVGHCYFSVSQTSIPIKAPWACHPCVTRRRLGTRYLGSV